MSVEITQVGYDDARVQLLVEEVQQEYVVRYGSRDQSEVDAADFAPPRGRFFVAVREGEPLAMGGWRHRAGIRDFGAVAAAEIKRMYVVRHARRTGLARLVLRTLETSARDDGCDLLVLETGMRQPEAVELYESAGYAPVTPFGYYKDQPLARYYGRKLTDLSS